MSADTLVIGRRHTTAEVAVAPRAHRSDAGQAPLVLIVFVAVQFLDGVLTYWGVTRFGIDLEMNALLASSMMAIGPAATLIAAKLLAFACGLVLYGSGYYRPLAAVSGLCLGLAVLPWLLFWAYTMHV